MNTQNILIDKWIGKIHIQKDIQGVYHLRKAVRDRSVRKSYHYFTQKEALRDFRAYVKLNS